MTRSYELMLAVRPDIEVTDKSAGELVKKLIGDAAKVVEVSLLGKKTLAYPIQKQKEATYIVATLSGLLIINDVEKRIQLGAEVLRFLLTVKK